MKQPLSDIAYRRILESLFEGRLSAGSFVSQGELVKVVGVPVTPLRDALRILEAEGVLKIHPRSGIQFIKLGLELTRSTYQFRAILESAAVRVFAETAEESKIAEIARRHETLIANIEKNGLNAAEQAESDALDLLLHYEIISTLRNPLIESSYRRIHNYLRLIRLDRVITPPLALRSLREHMEIISSCQARDPQRAENALQAHFAAAMQRHMGLY